jgi:hypothetical protein
MGFLRSKQRSTNMEQKFVNDTFKPLTQNMLAQGQEGLGNYFDALTGSDLTGVQRFRDSAGYQNIFDEAMRGVTSNAAARGLLNSGAMVRTAQDRAGQLAQQSYENYLQRLLQGSQTGIQTGMNAGGIVAEVGAQNERAGGLGGIVNAFKDIGSIGSSIGQFASVLSDRRLKENIVKIGEEPDGLGVYEFNYIGQPERNVGVMAQEVAELRPHALGPTTEDGYMTVNYGAL